MRRACPPPPLRISPRVEPTRAPRPAGHALPPRHTRAPRPHPAPGAELSALGASGHPAPRGDAQAPRTPPRPEPAVPAGRPHPLPRGPRSPRSRPIPHPLSPRPRCSLHPSRAAHALRKPDSALRNSKLRDRGQVPSKDSTARLSHAPSLIL
ncbi:uncharacterized protein [Bos indicus]|uniref:Basic proline-rich protein-like n=1 Tax=Bos indicus TaxID=9915 RepID=A0ABM4RI97_BOSIN